MGQPLRKGMPSLTNSCLMTKGNISSIIDVISTAELKSRFRSFLSFNFLTILVVAVVVVTWKPLFSSSEAKFESISIRIDRDDAGDGICDNWESREFVDSFHMQEDVVKEFWGELFGVIDVEDEEPKENENTVTIENKLSIWQKENFWSTRKLKSLRNLKNDTSKRHEELIEQIEEFITSSPVVLVKSPEARCWFASCLMSIPVANPCFPQSIPVKCFSSNIKKF